MLLDINLQALKNIIQYPKCYMCINVKKLFPFLTDWKKNVSMPNPFCRLLYELAMRKQ